MTELYPTDAELNALSGASDADQEVLFVTTGESPYYTSFYKMLYRLLDVARRAGDLRIYKDGDLTFGVRAGRYFDGDTEVDYAGAAAQALSNNQTNYIYLTAAGALTVNTSGFPVPSVTPHIPLATIVTAAGAYSINDGDIVDYRGRAMLTVCGAATGSLNVLDWQESVADELDFTAAEPAAPSLGDRYLNTGTGASSGTGQTVAANDIEEWNGTSWTQITPTEGGCCMVEDRDMLVGFNGASWVDIGTFALLLEAQTFFAASDISGAEAETLSDGSNADSLHEHIGQTAATQTITASGFTIAHNNKAAVILTLTGGNWTSDAATAIADGSVVGQRLNIYMGTSNGNFITLQDAANTKLAGRWYNSSDESSLTVQWDGSDWVEIGRYYTINTCSGSVSGGVGGSDVIDGGGASGHAGGGSITNSGHYSGSAGGRLNVNSGNDTGSVGGYGNENTDAGCATTGGKYGKTTLQYQTAHACGRFAATGDAQYTRFVLRGTTTDGAATELTDPERFVLADEKAYLCTVTVIGRQDTGGAHDAYIRKVAIERTGGTVALAGAVSVIGTDEQNIDAGSGVALTADDVNKSLKIEVTGAAGKNVRWVAVIEAVEVAYAD